MNDILNESIISIICYIFADIMTNLLCTLSSNHSDYLENHLKAVINKIESSKYVELLAIGIGHDVSKYYDRSITINRAEELGEVLLNELTQLLTDTSLKTA